MSDLFGPAISDIWGKSTRRRKRREAKAEAKELDATMEEEGPPKRPTKRRPPKKLSPEVSGLLGEAHAEMISGASPGRGSVPPSRSVRARLVGRVAS